jgi:carboxymethylenebutenolidase
MDKKFTDLYDDYVDGLLKRREFLKKLAVIAGGVAAANSLLPLLERHYAMAAIVSPDDPGLTTEYVTYPGKTGGVRAYLAQDKSTMKKAGVVIIHENRGLNPHIEDVARRVAKEGFLALAPDALSPMGGTPSDPDKARDMIRQLDAPSTLGDFLAAVTYLGSHPASTQKVGCMGFCWGGAMANQMAVNSPELAAAIPYYGSQPAAEDVPKIKAALLLHYAELDERINKGIPDFEAALKKHGKAYQMHIYKGAQHAFNNDTSERYHKEAAQTAWKRSMAFFSEKLKT